MGLLGSLFGGGGSNFSSGGVGNSTPTTNTTNTTTNTQTTNTNVDNRIWSSTTTVASDSGAIAAGREIANNALSFGGDALDITKAINADSLRVLGDLAGKSIEASRGLARDFADANSKSVKDAITGFQTLAVQSSSSSDDRVERVAKYAVLGIALAMVLPVLFNAMKGGGKAGFA